MSRKSVAKFPTNYRLHLRLIKIVVKQSLFTDCFTTKLFSDAVYYDDSDQAWISRKRPFTDWIPTNTVVRNDMFSCSVLDPPLLHHHHLEEREPRKHWKSQGRTQITSQSSIIEPPGPFIVSPSAHSIKWKMKRRQLLRSGRRKDISMIARQSSAFLWDVIQKRQVQQNSKIKTTTINIWQRFEGEKEIFDVNPKP